MNENKSVDTLRDFCGVSQNSHALPLSRSELKAAVVADRDSGAAGVEIGWERHWLRQRLPQLQPDRRRRRDIQLVRQLHSLLRFRTEVWCHQRAVGAVL